ncbi:lipopolysaccharide biosynthesis protein [Candidatus Nitrospira salsa]|nr:MAG: hypothetical protein NPIRA01_04730 [Nitrospirales bacterium]
MKAEEPISARIFPGTTWSRLVKGFGANAIGQVLNVASKILLVPLFLTAWGANIYGEWLVLSSLVAYLSLTELGGQVYIVNRLTQAYASQDFELFRKSLHSGLALFLYLPAAALLLLIIVLGLYPIEHTIGITETSHAMTVMIASLLGAQFLIALPQGLLLGIYRAIGLLPRGVMFGNLIILTHMVFTSGGLLFGANMLGIAALQILPYGIVVGMVIVDLKKQLPDIATLSLQHSSYSVMRTFLRPSLHFFSIQVSQLLSIQGTILVAGALLGSVQVVVFSALRTIANAIKQLLGLLSHTAWPEFTRLDMEGDYEKLHELFRFLLRSSLFGAFVFFIIFHFLGEEIFQLWLGETLTYNQNAMDLILLYVMQLVLWTACSHVLMAVNQHEGLARTLALSSLFTVSLSYTGAQYFGLIGMISGMILADALLPLWFVPRLLFKYCNRFNLLFISKEVCPIILTSITMMMFPWSVVLSIFCLGLWWLRCLPNTTNNLRHTESLDSQ